MELPQPFGPYLLLRRLGSGGMAEVFLAAARGIGGFEKLLCVKFIRREYADNESFISMLIEEAKMVSEVVHPNVAQVFDLGQVSGQYYIAMEYVDGVDAFKVLETAADRGVHLPVPAAALLVRDVAAGLAATHGNSAVTGRSLGIIHRDVSPHNLLISFDGEVKIIDFGVAKATLSAQQTEAGVIKGKYNYMSPEQASGKPVDARTDIFSAGIVLWELLAGEPLYPGENVPKVLEMARRARVPSIRRIRQDVPRPLEQILKKAVRKNPERRYATMDELQTELDDYLTQHAPGYGRRDLVELLEWLFPERVQEAVHLEGVTGSSLPRMERSDYVSPSRNSLVSAPGVAQAEALEAPELGPPDAPGQASSQQSGGDPQPQESTDASSGEIDAVPTRRAFRGEILARRRARAAGIKVPPVPITPQKQRLARRRMLVGLAAGLALLLGLGGYVIVRARGDSGPVLKVRSVPSGAHVLLDDRPTGVRTPAALSEGLTAGSKHTVRLHLEGYEPWESRITLEQQPTRINVQLLAQRARLWVRSDPSGAEVWVGGTRRGTTPVELRDLDPGEPVEVEVRHPGYESATRTYRWEGGRTGTLRVELNRNAETDAAPSSE